MSHSTSEPDGQACCQDLLRDVEQTYRKWFGANYDLDLIHAACATHAAYYLKGDPLWVLLVGAPGSCKTETINGLRKAGAFVISTITSPGALLSATRSSSKKDSFAATGGLLLRMKQQNKHFLIIKDMTTILSMHVHARQEVLAALREIYDGFWSRNVGNEGGRTLEWEGRIGILAAVTEAWDHHQAVIASFGDRFVVFRVDSCVNRQAASLQAMQNTGHEKQMREELGKAIEALLDEATKAKDVELSPEDHLHLLQAADLATTARTHADRDYKGEVSTVNSPEMPTRFAKQLVMLMRGAMAIGLGHDRALALTLRGARDSLPPTRRAVMELLLRYEELTIMQMVDMTSRPYNSLRRATEELFFLKVLNRRTEGRTNGGKPQKLYALRDEWVPVVQAMAQFP